MHCLLFVCQLRASRDFLVSAISYCLNFLSFEFGPLGTLWLQLSGVVSSFRLSISGLKVLSGSRCRLLSGLSVCQFQASRNSRTPTFGHSLVFLSFNSGPWGTRGFQLLGHFVRSSGTLKNYGAPIVGCCLVSLFVNFKPRGTQPLHLSVIILSFFSVCQIRASRESGARAVQYFFVFLFLNFAPRETQGFQPSLTVLVFVCQLWGSNDSGVPAVSCCLVFLLSAFSRLQRSWSVSVGLLPGLVSTPKPLSTSLISVFLDVHAAACDQRELQTGQKKAGQARKTQGGLNELAHTGIETP